MCHKELSVLGQAKNCRVKLHSSTVLQGMVGLRKETNDGQYLSH